MARVLNVPADKVQADTPREALENWDSMNHLTLIMELEGELGISFSFDDVVAVEGVADLIRVVAEQQAAAV